MILGTASDGEHRTQITTTARKGREPTSDGLQKARILADGCVQQTWNAHVLLLPGNHCFEPCLSFDSGVVPPEALASHAQALDESVDALMPMFVGQDRLEHVSIKRMRLPRIAGGFDVTPMLRSPMGFLAQYLAAAPGAAKLTGRQAIKTLGLVEAARDAQEKLRRMGLTMDERAMPRGTDAPGGELDVWTVEKETNKRETAAHRSGDTV